jgi:hypothetical protein
MFMKLKIDQLGIETTLENFINDWEYDFDEVKTDLDDGEYRDEWISIEKDDDNCLNVYIQSNFEIIQIINDIYNDEYLMVVKDVWNGDTEYTSFTLEGGFLNNITDINFKGGEYKEKTVLNDKELEKFVQLKNDDLINYTDLLKYQSFEFVKKKDLEKNGWEKTIESFNLFDWDKYKF